MARVPTRRHFLLAAGAALPVATFALLSRETDAPSPLAAGGGLDPDARPVRRIVQAQPTRDGAGVRLSRALGGQALPDLDPFLLLDEFHTDRADDYIAGFPDHPHRGFETVTYMIHGAMEHRDSVGNRGRLGPGSAQWMTAGRGLIHSEMPKQEQGLMWGFQLWVNLPAAQKMIKPRYQDIPPSAIPEVDIADARVRVVAGEAGGRRGPVDGVVVAPSLLDVTLAAGASFRHPLPIEHNAFVYVIDGAARIGPEGTPVARGELAVLGAGRSAVSTSATGARLLLLAAQPIGEPIARRGPFVMNTAEEIRQAFEDYRSGRLVGG
ncbi:pirin family protein [Polyangium sorediatum]|uniref:pirin family protein n=1 Tax=Polyangium sorediatum TaxID=889274 RepID=UPI0010BDEF18|nr:pirin family protein [Polyangium sorediatum]